MPLAQHLRELRKRLLLSFLGIGIGAIAGWFLCDLVLAQITSPLSELGDVQLNFQTVGAAFDMRMKVSLWIGLLISSPWWISQLTAFIWPALRRRERLYLLGFGFAGVVLFIAGVVFGAWLAPRAVEILSSFTPTESVMLLQADAYVRFYTRLVMAFGLSFLVPEVLVMLNFGGVLNARRMLRAWRWATVVSFIFAAIANPLPTPWPVIAQALVLLALYFGAVGISAFHDWWHFRKTKK